MTPQEISLLIKDVPDFPKPGIIFKDITPLLADPRAFRAAVEHMGEMAQRAGADGILAIESRGFLFGAALANRLSLPLHLVRKQGKLPRSVVSMRYELEYGFDHVEMHADAVEPGARYLVVDDVIATGGTAAATVRLVRQQKADVAACIFCIELGFLGGREALAGVDVQSLIVYRG